MDAREETACMNEREESCGVGRNEAPELTYVTTASGVELGNHAFLRPLPACCAQIASPFWARVIGSVSNTRSSEVLLRITARIFDKQGLPLGEHEDFMVLDPGAGSEFDIKISTFYENAWSYALEAAETQEF